MIFPIQYSFLVTIGAILIIAFCLYSGYKDGFLSKGIALLSTIICIMLSWLLSGMLSTSLPLFPRDYSLFTETILDSPIYAIMNRFFLFVILLFILRFLMVFVKPLFRSINLVPIVGRLNRILGVVLGFLQGSAIIWVIAFTLSSPLFANGNEVLATSHLDLAKDGYRHALFMFDDGFEKLESIQKIVTPSQVIAQQDIENIQSWLAHHGFSDLEQQEVMHLINQRNGR